MLAASDRGSYFEQEKLIALDEEEQNRLENETVSASRARIEGKGKDESADLGPNSQVSWQKLARPVEQLLPSIAGKKISRNQFVGFVAQMWLC